MPRKNLRRAASKEALKQMQLLSANDYEEEDTETLEITSDEDVMNADMPPKKKYRLSHRKSSDGNDRDVIVLKTVNSEEVLKLECWPEEDLEPVQKEYHNKIENEVKELDSKIEQIMQQTSSEVIYQGETCAAYELDTSIVPGLTYIGPDPKKKTATVTSTKSQPNIVLQSPKTTNTQNAYQIVMDPRIGLIVGTMTPTTSTAMPPPLQSKPSTAIQARQPRRRGRNSVQITTQSQPTLTRVPKPAQSTVVQLRPAESTAVGGLSTGSTTPTEKIPSSSNTVVDLTAEDNRPVDDSREISFNKLQGKTFPSLVVVARPHLGVKDVSGGSDRSKLDSKVKNVLLHVPTKFTEWLIQQGLLRSEQTCTNHPTSKLKLGMYSDVSKFPYSGGYVWISECCPHRFVSVFSGSLFEGSPHPPSVILKLIYHWACQTNIQNVVQWVKVDNAYVKGMNTWLRAICTVALHAHLPPLGGAGRHVEVGVISLGTTTQDGQQRQVKVEVLGILETSAKLIRLRAVEPLNESDRNPKKRFLRILEPLVQWVHPESTIVTDLTVDKPTLLGLGFKNIYQSSMSDTINNHTIMDYLRRIVPRMFQNTLSLLSRQIIQQFLDELVWREWYGSTAAQCFDNILIHISEQTRADTGQSLILRLNKVSTNPFKNWSIQPTNSQITIINKPSTTAPSESGASSIRRTGRTKKIINPVTSAITDAQQRPTRTISPDIPEQMVPLENYYYGTIPGQEANMNNKTTWSIKCSMCKSMFNNNIKLMGHLFSHAHNVTGGIQQCRYCLSSVGSQEGLAKHILSSHPYETKFQDGYVCIVCESKFANTFLLGKHLSKEHVPSELPYQCGTCGFRCSSHRQVIDHFYKFHNCGSTIQCPFCLKSTTMWSAGRIMPQNLNFFLQHLQKHQKKTMAKKCPKCALWFIHKDTLKEHQLNMHLTQRRKVGLVAWSIPKTCIMVPKSKQDKQVWEDTKREINFTNLTIDVPNKLLCKECKTSINTPKHFQALECCSNRNCQYSTCCKNAMKTHTEMCKDLNASLPVASLPKAMYCVCGYSDDDGNTLAKHLAQCERKSAYPSAEAAKNAIKTHSMLDVLGLVRRPEEPPTVHSTTIEVIELDKEDSDKEGNRGTKRKRSKKQDNDVTVKPKKNDETEQEKDSKTKDKCENNSDSKVLEPECKNDLETKDVSEIEKSDKTLESEKSEKSSKEICDKKEVKDKTMETDANEDVQQNHSDKENSSVDNADGKSAVDDKMDTEGSVGENKTNNETDGDKAKQDN